MEEDNCEENIIQKKKKQKKKTSQYENEIGTTEVKKEKKCKKVKTVAKEEEGLNESGEQEEKRKIKKKKKVDDSNFVKEIIDEEKTNVRKKIKKTRLANNDDNQLENIQIVVKEEKVEKRKKLKDTQNKPEIKTEEEQIQNDRIPKKGKKIKTDALTGNTEPTGDVKKKKKDRTLTSDDAFTTKTKREIKVEENGIKSGEPEVEKGKLKKKKKEELNDSLEETKKSKKKRETKDVKILKKYKSDDEKETFPEKGKPKEKKKRIKEEPATVYVEDVNEEETEPKKKKKRIKEEPATVYVEDVTEEEMEPKKKRKKTKADESRKKDVTMTADARITKGKKNKTVLEVKQIDSAAKKIKKERKDSFSEKNDFQNVSKVDVVFLSKTNGNTDEININRERRKALQMEIDVASQPKKTTKPTGLGQWSTAQFDSSNQQQKFLRLMGGFKKGFQPAVETSGGGGMALGKDAQQRLQQGLMGEFERAHSRRMDFSNKGAGLGFTVPSNKKFFIDANASRSVRFDD